MVQILFLNLNGSDKRSSNIYGAQKQNKNSADVYLVRKNKNMCLIFKYQIELVSSSSPWWLSSSPWVRDWVPSVFVLLLPVQLSSFHLQEWSPPTVSSSQMSALLASAAPPPQMCCSQQPTRQKGDECEQFDLHITKYKWTYSHTYIKCHKSIDNGYICSRETNNYSSLILNLL